MVYTNSRHQKTQENLGKLGNFRNSGYTHIFEDTAVKFKTVLVKII